jgi:hypothetical protein
MSLATRYGGWAVVTGASSGIGEAFARQLAEAGMPCVVAARRRDRLERLCEQLQAAHGVDIRVVEADLSHRAGVDHLVASVQDVEVGLLVNNAGFGHIDRMEDQDPAQLEAMVYTNCTAPVLLTRALVPPMLERGRGGLVFVSSVAGYVNMPYDATYAATKAFDRYLGMGLWAELRGRGIDVTTLVPGPTRTEFLTSQGVEEQKEREFMKSGDTAEAIVALTLRKLGRSSRARPARTLWMHVVTHLFPEPMVASIAERVMRPMLKER